VGYEDEKDKLKINGKNYVNIGVNLITRHIHQGFITKVKYYPDINFLLTSALDGFIHVHDINDLEYKTDKTFKLHKKGVNSFAYSVKNRLMASCGEERQIIIWTPHNLATLTHLSGHNTSVQDLTINEDWNHLISLGTDKVVIIWDIKSFQKIHTLFDKVCYRPEDRLTSIVFDKFTNNILLGSRKVNPW
jgi:WD40 repeat protein